MRAALPHGCWTDTRRVPRPWHRSCRDVQGRGRGWGPSLSMATTHVVMCRQPSLKNQGDQSEGVSDAQEPDTNLSSTSSSSFCDIDRPASPESAVANHCSIADCASPSSPASRTDFVFKRGGGVRGFLRHPPTQD